MTDNNFLVPQIKPESMQAKKLPCPFSPAGMLQPSHLQPPPMFGPRGNFVFLFLDYSATIHSFKRDNNSSEAFGTLRTL